MLQAVVLLLTLPVVRANPVSSLRTKRGNNHLINEQNSETAFSSSNYYSQTIAKYDDQNPMDHNENAVLLETNKDVGVRMRRTTQDHPHLKQPGDVIKGRLYHDDSEVSFVIEKVLHQSSPPSELPRFVSVAPRLSSYVTENKLGEGGMGAVYLVKDSVTLVRYAAKVSLDPGHSYEVEREYDITSIAYKALRDPNMPSGVIGPVRLLRDKTSQPVMIMPLYPVGDLGHVFDTAFPKIHSYHVMNEKRIEKALADTAVRLISEVHLTLMRLHGERIAHRDIKPGNILVSGEAITGTEDINSVLIKLDGWHAKVSDFGLAKQFSRVDAESHKVKTYSIAGTPLTLPPELVITHPLYQLDTYSFAQTIFWLMLRGDISLGINKPFIKNLIPNKVLRCRTRPTYEIDGSSDYARFVSLRGVFEQGTVDAVVGGKVRIDGHFVDPFGGPGKFVRSDISIEPPLLHLGMDCVFRLPDGTVKFASVTDVRRHAGTTFYNMMSFRDRMEHKDVNEDMVVRIVLRPGDFLEHQRYNVFWHLAMLIQCEDEMDRDPRLRVNCEIRYSEDGSTVFVPASSLRAPRKGIPIEVGELVDVNTRDDFSTSLWGTVISVDEIGTLDVETRDGTGEKSILPAEVRRIYPEGTECYVRLYPEEFIDMDIAELDEQAEGETLPGIVESISSHSKNGRPTYTVVLKPPKVFYKGDLIVVDRKDAVVISQKRREGDSQMVRIRYANENGGYNTNVENVPFDSLKLRPVTVLYSRVQLEKKNQEALMTQLKKGDMVTWSKRSFVQGTVTSIDKRKVKISGQTEEFRITDAHRAFVRDEDVEYRRGAVWYMASVREVKSPGVYRIRYVEPTPQSQNGAVQKLKIDKIVSYHVLRRKIKQGEKVFYLKATTQNNEFMTLGQIQATSKRKDKENAVSVLLKNSGHIANFESSDIRTLSGLCGLHDLASQHIVGAKCVQWAQSGIRDVQRAVSDVLLPKVNTGTTTEQFKAELIQAIETKSSLAPLRTKYLNCLKENFGNRYNDVETMVYLLDMLDKRYQKNKLLPTLKKCSLGVETDVHVMNDDGTTSSLSETSVCGDNKPRPSKWFLAGFNDII